MLAKDVMVPTPVGLETHNRLREAVSIFRDTRLGAIPIVDANSRLIGIFTRSNLLDCILDGVDINNELSGHYLTDVICLEENNKFSNFSELGQWLLKASIGQTPVIDLEGHPIGFITRDAIVYFLLDQIEKHRRDNATNVFTAKTRASSNDSPEELYNINGTQYNTDSIIGISPAIEKLKNLVSMSAQTNSTILITGECGTGKELFAQAIHNASNRWYQPFININCSAELTEAELFGYVTGGTLTGINKQGKPGKFELADKSTIFLDEVGDVPLTLQGKLLRVIQEKEIVRVGNLYPKKIDVRIIAATNQDLKRLCDEGKFRKDLYYRLKAISLDIPPLRDRPEDIPYLVDYFIVHYSIENNKPIEGITKEAMRFLQSYDWPGNVRELSGIMERAVLFCQTKTIDIEHLETSNNSNSENAVSTTLSLSGIEKEAIIKALQITDGNKSKTAKILGISRSTLYKKLEML